MDWHETLQFLSPFFPEELRAEMDMLLPGELREIRIRAERPTAFVTATRTVFMPWFPEKAQLAALVEGLSEHSLYARTEETRQGYITLRGGHRMGLCGHVAHSDDQSVLSGIGSVCIRIAGEWPGCADTLLACMGDTLQSVLVIGPPGSGKTTLLRDLTRQLASGRKACQIAVVDERSELAACVGGIPQLHIGESTDVLDGLRKQEAFTWLLRSMAPQLIVTDELGSDADAAAVLDAIHSGIAVCASVHGSSLQDAASRPAIAALMSRRVFGLYAVLSPEGGCQITGLHDRTGSPIPLP